MNDKNNDKSSPRFTGRKKKAAKKVAATKAAATKTVVTDSQILDTIRGMLKNRNTAVRVIRAYQG